jgi:hypothetical protein
MTEQTPPADNLWLVANAGDDTFYVRAPHIAGALDEARKVHPMTSLGVIAHWSVMPQHSESSHETPLTPVSEQPNPAPNAAENATQAAAGTSVPTDEASTPMTP